MSAIKRRSFPLDCRDRLRGEIIKHAVYAFDFVQDPVGDLSEQFIGDRFDRGGGRVNGVDSSENYRPFICALVVLDAGRLEIGNYSEILPNLALQTVRGKFFAKDRVGFADSFEPVTGYRTYAADTETRAGEGLTIYHVIGKAELFAYHAHLILIEELDRLAKLKFKILGQAADSMMSFYADASRISG